MGFPVQPKVSAVPILERIEARGGVQACLGPYATTDDEPLTVAIHNLTNRVKRGDTLITVWHADRLCIQVLGLNPALVYGQAWWEWDDEG